MKDATGSRYVTIARLLRPRGNRGELIAENLSSEHFETEDAKLMQFFGASEVFLLDSNRQRKETAVEKAWLHRGRLVLKLKNVDSISAAEVLRNVDLQVPREHLGPAPDDNYYFEDLIGCEVHNAADGRLIGSVKDVLELGGSLLLEVDREGHEVLIPFVKDICVDIAPEKKMIRVRMPDGLENLNL